MQTILCFSLQAQGAVNYGDFVQRLNWRDCPVPAPAQQPGSSLNPNEWLGTSTQNQVSAVNYNLLIQDVFGENKA